MLSTTKKTQKNIKAKQPGETISPENEKWLKERPTRLEVGNYVNALMERHYMPVITNYIQMSSMVLQAILIEKGVCTGDEIKNITEKFVSEQQRRMAMETAEDGLISRVSRAAERISEGKWDISAEDEKMALKSALDRVHDILVDINFNETPTITEVDIENCAENLKSIQKSIVNGVIRIQEDKVKVTLQILLGDIIARFEKGIGNEAKGDEESKD